MGVAEDSPTTPEREPSRKRPPPREHDGYSRRRRRYEYDDYPRRGGRDREMETMSREVEKSRSYGQRQKRKKSTIKRQAAVMARALGESESNVRILANYVKRFSQSRMNLNHFPCDS